LARLGGHVTSVEIHDALQSGARAKLAAHAIENVDLYSGDASHGWERSAPYDVIAVTGSLPLLEESFQNSLAIGGRLFIIVGLTGVEEPERFVL
jgi:protein-L-isoaspartate(D-aspartate) O-methyltransferase